jgi:CDP-2,3-bis-(O-geranylgeranyl)-sn-glycerol synthase
MTITDPLLEAVLAGFWLMMPALVPNSAAVLFGGGRPMDFGRSWRGNRLLGDGKTWRGFVGGAVSGSVFGLIQIALADRYNSEESFGFGAWPASLLAVIAISFGSMIGDTLGAFTKRRMGYERGAKVPILDQYNFVLGALVFAAFFRPSWFLDHYIDGYGIAGLLLFLIIVPILHRGINIIGYKLGKKDVPW